MRKYVLITLLLSLTGCANFDPERFQQGLRQAYNTQSQIDYNNAQYNSMMRAQNVTVQTRPPGSLAGSLTGQHVDGFLRYCAYSNGVVNTISSTALCPISN
jgi:outer membrane lipoprotein SlyB